MNENEIEALTRKIAHALWRLQDADKGNDKIGIDMWDMETRHRVQLKGDFMIAYMGNLYFEMFEKTKGQEQQPWRVSPHYCQDYIFVTHEYALYIPVDAVASVCEGQNIGPLHLEQINPTSIGYRLSVALFSRYIRFHDFWPIPDPSERQQILAALHWYLGTHAEGTTP